MARFMLIFHESHGLRSLPPAEAEQAMGKMKDWFGKIRASGKYVASDKLREEGGKVVRKQNERTVVVDGPYAEAKEVVGGYLTIRLENYDEAIELSRTCPLLEFGGRIEIRQTDSMGCGGE
jgi:hypothetical protein